MGVVDPSANYDSKVSGVQYLNFFIMQLLGIIKLSEYVACCIFSWTLPGMCRSRDQERETETDRDRESWVIEAHEQSSYCIKEFLY